MIVLFVALHRMRRLELAIGRVAAGGESPTPSDAAAPSGWRRWFTFRLSTLLIGVTLLACVLGMFGRELHRARRQGQAVARLRSAGAAFIDRSFERREGPFICYMDEWSTSDDGVLPPDWVRQTLGAEFGMYVDRVMFQRDQNYLSNPLNAGPLRCTDEDLACLPDLRGLKHLELEGTNITDQALRHVGNAPTVTYLSLSHTSITGQGFPFLSKLTDLRTLELNDTDLEDQYVAELCQHELHAISLPSQATDKTLAQLADCKSLRVIDLEDTQVTAAGLKHLRSMPHLMCVYLSKDASTLAGVQEMKKIQSLRSLRLYAGNIDETQLQRLAEMTQVKHLDLSEYQYELIDSNNDILSQMTHLAVLKVGPLVEDPISNIQFGGTFTSDDVAAFAEILDLPDTVVETSNPFNTPAGPFGSLSPIVGGGGLF